MGEINLNEESPGFVLHGAKSDQDYTVSGLT